MTEEMTGTDQAVPGPVFKGVAAKVNAQMENLSDARYLAQMLEGGIDTQAGIRKVSVKLRDTLIASSRAIHKLYSEILLTREILLDNVNEVASENKKAALEKKINEMQDALDNME